MDDAVRLASGLILAAGTLAALVRCQRSGASSLPVLLYASLLAFLAADKLLRFVDAIHEGFHARGVGDPPLLNGIDDLVYLGVGAMVLAAAFRYRRLIVRSRVRAFHLVAVAILFGVAFLIDALGPAGGPITRLEQLLELVGALLLVTPAVAPLAPIGAEQFEAHPAALDSR